MNRNQHSLGDRAAVGIAWVTSQSLAAKVIAYFAQLALAYYLLPSDFGLFGLASTVAAFGAVLNQGGVAKVLVHRQKSFEKWATAGLWLSLCFGFLVSIVMLLFGYFGSNYWTGVNGTKLFQLVAILAILPPMTALESVPKALLQSKLQFKSIAAVSTAVLLATSLLKVGMAATGWGAFSFAVPAAIFAPIRAFAFWWLARPKIHPGFMLRRWKYMLSDSLMIVLTTLWYTLITHGDYVILAGLANDDELGLYFFAFNYAVQAIILFTQGVASVSFPALAGLRDQPLRQVAAFGKAARILAAVVFPVCFLQAAVAAPLLSEYFPAIWKPTIPMLQMLSIGMAGRTVSWLAASLMEAQGEFKKRMWLGLASAIAFLVMAYTGSKWGGALGLSCAVAAYYPMMAFATVYVALPKTHENKIKFIGAICLLPTLLSAVSIGLPYLFASRMIPDPLAQIIFLCLSSFIIYTILIRIWMTDAWDELSSRLARITSLVVQNRT